MNFLNLALQQASPSCSGPEEGEKSLMHAAASPFGTPCSGRSEGGEKSEISEKTPAVLLADLWTAGFTLHVEGEGLRVSGPGEGLTPERAAAIRRHKRALLGLLSYHLVVDAAGLEEARRTVAASPLVGLDVETAAATAPARKTKKALREALDPCKGRVRLLSLAAGRGVYVIDCAKVDPRPLWPDLSAGDLVGHYLAFDLAFLARLGFAPAGALHDTCLLARLLSAGTKVSAAVSCGAKIAGWLEPKRAR
jgi:hypothetical protein